MSKNAKRRPGPVDRMTAAVKTLKGIEIDMRQMRDRIAEQLLETRDPERAERAVEHISIAAQHLEAAASRIIKAIIIDRT
ncbi:MAG TPA: hypothetical protein VNF91_08300 [Candidatus Acidoferrum sp.]|nr:hypothetical protein [Candidatus Acidoferrum sp.]